MNSLVDEMRAYYARRAPVYDASMGYNDPAVVDRLAPVAASLRRQLAGRRVLEIACGPGFWTRIASETAAAIVATDCNDSVLVEAPRKRLDASVVSFAIADAYDLSAVAPDERFNGAFGVDWLAHVPSSRSREFLAGLHARLVPGARIVFCDQLPGPESFTGLFDEEGNHLQERELPDGTRFHVIKHFRSDDEFHRLLSPWAIDVTIERFTECRRVVVGYTRRG